MRSTLRSAASEKFQNEISRMSEKKQIYIFPLTFKQMILQNLDFTQGIVLKLD